MTGDVSTWVFIMDCTGMTLPACNPRVGYGITHAMATYYPERLGLVICIHHNPVFQGVWNAFKVFLDPNTVAKMQLLRKKSKFSKAFTEHFDAELSSWVMEEVKLNKKLTKHRTSYNPQREFWKAPETPTVDGAVGAAATKPSATTHDPRGCPSYVKKYIDTFLSSSNKWQPGQQPIHHPHPNIVDELRGVIKQVDTTQTPTMVTNENGNGNGLHPSVGDNSDDDELPETPSPMVLTDLSEEYQIPQDVYEQHKLQAVTKSS
jgi:hypothetical protein